ncbi:hypothetical protein SO802_003934 [Lithocarpus litseifolius]|uniref:Alcohol dehydrogenase-like 7 n=1 Tax=Lithocarpus litseifolius TaxID=425828 RepID=A0AAW2E5E9_9ROSI
MDEKSSSETRGKPIRCRAAVSRKPGEPLVIEEVMVAPPMAHEVQIRIICTSLCHSDITFWKLKGDQNSSFADNGLFGICIRLNVISVVESVGEDVDEVSEGDTVIPTFMPDCGDCADCRSKKSSLCSKLPFKVSPWMPRHETSRFTDLKGEVLYHFLFVSSFSEYTVVDVAHVTKIDPSTGVGAAWRTANVEKGSTVVIFGLGSIGLAVAEGARLCGATKIIGVDPSPDKFENGKYILLGYSDVEIRNHRLMKSTLFNLTVQKVLCHSLVMGEMSFAWVQDDAVLLFLIQEKNFGVTDFVNSGNFGDKSMSQVINEMTDGGADYCFECVGMASLVHEAYACCRKGWGKTIVLGVDKPGAKLSLSSFEVLHSGKSLVGSLFGGLKAKSDIPILLKKYLDKELQLDKFVTHEVRFDDINKAFDLLIEGNCLRCVIWMDKQYLAGVAFPIGISVQFCLGGRELVGGCYVRLGSLVGIAGFVVVVGLIGVGLMFMFFDSGFDVVARFDVHVL